jgi:6-phosphogluconolactonase
MQTLPQHSRGSDSSLTVRAYPSTAAFESQLVQHISTAANQSIVDRGHFSFVVTGGNTMFPIYKHLRQIKTDWRSWSIAWTDERCLPKEHPERNSRQAFETWLSHVPIPKENIFVIPAELGPVAGSECYSRSLAGMEWFDLVILTLGQDGHVASIFQTDETSQSGIDVVPVFDSPKFPANRVSLSLERLAKTRELILLAVGKQKAEALANLNNESTEPASQLAKQCCVTVWSSDIT